MRALKRAAFLSGALLAAGAPGFEIPQPGHRFVFPRDDGAHPGFRIEWWYLTGHLKAAAPKGAPGAPRPFGFEATFFRIEGPQNVPDPNPDFSVRELYLAHMAVSDLSGRRFLDEARINRAGWDADAAVGTLDVRNGPWSLRLAGMAPPRIVVRGGVRDVATFELAWTPAKPLVVFGEDGVSRKGPEPAEASYYLTFSRLRGGGSLTLDGRTYAVQGEAWMDHEISSSDLGPGQVGWDWTCVQFGSAFSPAPWELMLYRMRRADGSSDPYSRLQWVDPEGRTVDEPFAWKVLSWWTSPHSGARYPSRVRLETRDPRTGAPAQFEIDPLLKDQELANPVGGGPYWEGDCRVLDAAGHDVGSAYLELTGYARPLKF